MGHVYQKLRLQNPNNGKQVELIGIIDTGATNTVIPESIANELSLKIISKSKVQTAKGKMNVKRSFCLVKIKNQADVVPVVIAKTIKQVLIGVTTLESLGFKVDPSKGKLEKTSVLLFRLE